MKWTYDRQSEEIRDEDGWGIAEVIIERKDTDTNGLLLAAAPELLAALEKAVGILKEYYFAANDNTEHTEEEGDSDIWEFEDVIAKAKGGEPR